MPANPPSGGSIGLDACIARVRAGDSSAFEEIVRRYEELVLRVARRMTGNRDDALDVAQDTFLRIYRSLGRFSTGRRFESWVYQIVVHASYDMIRRRGSFRFVSLDESEGMGGAIPGVGSVEPTAETDAAAAELRKRLDGLLAELPSRLRSVFILRDVEGLDTSEIAGILGCREVTVRRHSMEARERVRKLLSRRFPGLAPP